MSWRGFTLNALLCHQTTAHAGSGAQVQVTRVWARSARWGAGCFAQFLPVDVKCSNHSETIFITEFGFWFGKLWQGLPGAKEIYCRNYLCERILDQQLATRMGYLMRTEFLVLQPVWFVVLCRCFFLLTFNFLQHACASWASYTALPFGIEQGEIKDIENHWFWVWLAMAMKASKGLIGTRSCLGVRWCLRVISVNW